MKTKKPKKPKKPDKTGKTENYSKEQVKQVMNAVEDEMPDASDMMYWSVVHERLGLAYGKVFECIRKHPKFFGVEKDE